MKLKEIKPGMVIHCQNDKEYSLLNEETVRTGYGELPCRHRESSTAIQNLLFVIEEDSVKWMIFGDLESHDIECEVTELSDLIIPELTAEEVLQWLDEHTDEDFIDVFGRTYHSFSGLFADYNPEQIVSAITKWKFDHEKKEPEIETVDICRIIEVLPDSRKRCVHEEDIKPDPELPFGSEQIAVEEILKRYCMEHEGEFIAVHEVISRVKAVWSGGKTDGKI